MRAVLQRVSSGRVAVDGDVVGEIGPGLVVLLGVAHGDGEAEARWMADKLCELRIFRDDAGKMNLSLEDTGGSVLLVSQFTLVSDCRRGRRPSFAHAAGPELGEQLYLRVGELIRGRGVPVETGVFGARMAVSIENDGPVSFVLDTPEREADTGAEGGAS
ncbi:MAG: D-aminoacyl-tRNA deacylase [Candidatus Eisenbacteria bacterium]